CVRAATRLLSIEPLREDIHRALMRAYAAQGRINLALRQYENCRGALQRELHLQPEPETRHLHEMLRARRTTSPRPASASEPSRVQAEASGEPLRPSTHYVKSA